jgi:DNA-binding response OmpR family regulator
MDIAADERGARLRQAHILVVEDDPGLRETILYALKHRGFSTEGAEDGIQALSHLERGHFDVVITDLQMPRLDGLGLLREIHWMESPPRVVVQSAVMDAPLEILLRRAGAFHVLTKGTSLDGLVETVAKACGLARSFPAFQACAAAENTKA